jgi:hypothetical protein
VSHRVPGGRQEPAGLSDVSLKLVAALRTVEAKVEVACVYDSTPPPLGILNSERDIPDPVAMEDEPRLGAPLAPTRPEMKVLFLFTFLAMGAMMLAFATSRMAKAHFGPF